MTLTYCAIFYPCDLALLNTWNKKWSPEHLIPPHLHHLCKTSVEIHSHCSQIQTPSTVLFFGPVEQVSSWYHALQAPSPRINVLPWDLFNKAWLYPRALTGLLFSNLNGCMKTPTVNLSVVNFSPKFFFFSFWYITFRFFFDVVITWLCLFYIRKLYWEINYMS